MKQLQTNRARYSFPTTTALAPLPPYTRCPCGTCVECRSNARWDRIFAKFEAKNDRDVRGLFGSTLNEL
jgi:hypothetical protein